MMNEKYGRSAKNDFIEGYNGPAQASPQTGVSKLEGFDARLAQGLGSNGPPPTDAKATNLPPPPPKKK